MADGVPPGSEGERTDVAARPRGDDEILRSAFAALLGLRAEEAGVPATVSTAVSLPPPRPAPPAPESPADFVWAPSEAPALHGGWERPEALDEPPPAADDFWSAADDPVPPPEVDAVPPPEVDAAREPWGDDFWTVEGEPASADAPPAELGEPPPPDLFLPAHDESSPPPVSLDRAEEKAAADSSLVGLQHVGLGGPLNTAMGDLRRLADDNFDRGAPPPETGARSLRALFDDRVVRMQDWWAGRRRDLLPGVAVALLIVIAFAVVLLTRDGDAGRSVGTESTRVPPAATQTTLPPPEQATTLPLPEDVVPPEPTDPAAGAPAGPGAPAPGDGRAPAGARTPPRARNAPAPALAPAPAAAPKPAPAPVPTSPPGTTATTQPPPTSAPPTSRPPQSSDPCDNAWTPEARQACLESRGQGGSD